MEDYIMLPVVNRNQAWLPSIFNDLFDGDFAVMPAKQFASPAVNIKETEKDFEIEVAAPGMTKDDFTVSIDNDNELVIALEKKSNKECKDNGKDCKEDKECREGRCRKVNYLRKEFSYTSYHQSFTLPDNIDLDAISAEMVNGVLDITLPKRLEQEKVPAQRRIEIK